MFGFPQSPWPNRRPRFLLGKIIVSTPAKQAINETWLARCDVIAKHQLGEWGDVSSEVRKENEYGCEYGNDLISAHTLGIGKTVWIATDDMRRFTIVILASEMN